MIVLRIRMNVLLLRIVFSNKHKNKRNEEGVAGDMESCVLFVSI